MKSYDASLLTRSDKEEEEEEYRREEKNILRKVVFVEQVVETRSKSLVRFLENR